MDHTPHDFTPATTYLLAKDLSHILHNQGKIMATLAELQAAAVLTDAKVTALQATVDAEQEQVAAAIALLQGNVDGGTDADRQAVLDLLNGVNDRLSALSTDVEGTV